jgi:hypothetical protein
MKYTSQIFILSCILTCILIIPGVTASGVIVTGYEMQPSVLIPGETGILTVTLTNTGQSALPGLSAGNTSFTGDSSSTAIIDSIFLDGKKNIEVISGNSQFEGSLGPGQSMSTSFYIRAPVRSGIFFPELLIRIRNHESVKFPIPVNVNTAVQITKQPALLISYAAEDRVKPGTDVPVEIMVMNKGKSTADEITIRIADQDPMVAARSATSGHIPHLEPGTSSVFSLILTIDKEARSGIHEIPLEIRYSTTDGKSEQFTDTITLDIRGESGISIASLTTDPVRLTEKEPFDLLIRLENPGTADARSVRGSVSLPFTGTREAFIGTIEPDSDAPAVFVLTAGDPGDYSYTLTVTYLDDWGEHTISDTLTMTVAGKEDGMVYLLGIIILLAIIVVGYRVLSRRGA